MAFTNAINATQEGVQYLSSTGVWSGEDGGTAGHVLTSNGTGVAPTFQAASGGSGITTIDGDTGSITGATVTIYADNAATNCGSSVLFANSGTISTLNVTDGNENTLIGLSAGNLTILGGNNNGFGKGTLAALTSGSLNAGYGESSLALADSGSFNSGYGNLTLSSVLGGSYNAAFGYNAGSNYTGSESDNILIMNNGTIGESNTVRIGTQGAGSGQQNLCFVAGITGVSVATPQFVTINPSTGQLGTSPTTALNYTSVNNAASPYTVLSTDYYISVDTSGGVVTLLFPNAPTTKQTWIVKDRTGTAATSAITVTTVGGAVNIDGATSYVMGTNFQSVDLLFNGTTYEVF